MTGNQHSSVFELNVLIIIEQKKSGIEKLFFQRGFAA